MQTLEYAANENIHLYFTVLSPNQSILLILLILIIMALFFSPPRIRAEGELEASYLSIFFSRRCMMSDFHVGICKALLPLVHQHWFLCPCMPDENLNAKEAHNK